MNDNNFLDYEAKQRISILIPSLNQMFIRLCIASTETKVESIQNVQVKALALLHSTPKDVRNLKVKFKSLDVSI